MTRFYLIGFFVLMCFDTMAQLGFKFAAGIANFPTTFTAGAISTWILGVITERWIYLSVCGYLGAFVTWMTLLKHAPIGPAFAASHLYIVSVMLITVAFFPEEHINALQAVGCLFIMGGIFVLAAETPTDPKKMILDETSEPVGKSVRN